MSTFRRRLFHELEPSHREGGLSRLNRFIVLVILVSVVFVVVESEPAIHGSHPTLFHAVEILFGLVFLLEYVARVWVAAEDPRYSDGLRGRLRYAMTPSALLDLLAVTPQQLRCQRAVRHTLDHQKAAGLIGKIQGRE